MASRNVDLPAELGSLVVLSPRGVQRTSRDAPAGDTPLAWTARYGSVGFHLSRSEWCGDGMNENGLAGGLLGLEGTQYPSTSSDRALSLTHWLQYYLDSCSTVEEAVAAADGVKIYAPPDLPLSPHFHLVLHDATGDSAVMEYDASGALIIYRPDTSGAGPRDIYNGVLTNEPFYPQQIYNLDNYTPWGGTEDLPGGDTPDARFVRGSWCLKQMYTPATAEEAVAYAFNYIQYVIEPVIQGDEIYPTYWTTIKDLTNLLYYFNTFLKPGMRSMAFEDLDFTEGQSIKAQDIEALEGGDAADAFIAATVGPDGNFSYKKLSINPHNLAAGSLFDYTIYLGETIGQRFDLYTLAETPMGIYTLYPTGLIKAGIHKALDNMPGAGAPYANTFPVVAAAPRTLSGQAVTFYIAAVQAGKTPPVAQLSDLAENTPYVIMMDKERMTVK